MPDSLAAHSWGQRGRYLVPRADSGSGRWFVHRLFAPHGGKEVLLLRCARWLPGSLGARLLLRSPEDRAGEAVDRFEGALAAVPGFAPFGEAEARWVLILDEPESRRRRLVAFRFAPGAGKPDLVMKVRPSPAPGLVREARGLRRLREALPPAVGASLPEVLHHHAGEDFHLLALSALSGPSGYVAARSRGLRRAARQLSAAARWLVRFQTASRAARRETEPSAPLPPWESLSGGSDLSGDPPGWYTILDRALADRPLPSVASHGDFWPRNFLLPESRHDPPGVVDWEAWSEAASPLGDLFLYPFALGQVVRWKARGEASPMAAFRRTFVEDNPLSRQVASYARRVIAALGQPPEILAPLFRLYLLQGARGQMPVPQAFESPEASLAAYRLVERRSCVFSG